jgi:hypothetical protein
MRVELTRKSDGKMLVKGDLEYILLNCLGVKDVKRLPPGEYILTVVALDAIITEEIKR